jgi:hypothetical protein
MGVIISILFLLLVNCGGNNQQDQQTPPDSTKKAEVDYHSVDGFFSGNHPLALISNITKDSHDTGYVCLSDTGNSGTAKFYFQTDGFLIALLPMNKIRISFLADTSKENPYCKFRWTPSDFKESEWANNVVYAVVCVKPNQIYRK